jgi:hypothetical protein
VTTIGLVLAGWLLVSIGFVLGWVCRHRIPHDRG